MRNFFINLTLFFIASRVSARTVEGESGAPTAVNMSDRAPAEAPVSVSAVKSRRRRYISQSDMLAIVDYHNQVRARVFPPAANMEYMVRDLQS